MPDNLEQFPFDIQVLAFNRPEYLERCLLALKAQTLPIDPKRIYFWQDGYSGSKDEHLQLQDNTSLSLELIKLYFPDSKIYVCLENRGIGLIYKAAEENAFIRHGNEWGVFIEEDNILQNYYLEVILKLINNFQEYDEIVQLDAFGDYRNQIGDDYFIPMHSWAFALRARHYFERKDLLSGYEEILGEHAYFKRDSSRIINYFDQFGITPLGNSQDYIKRILMSHFKKIALTTAFSGAYNIGAHGEHFNPENYSQLGYQSQRPSDIQKTLPPITQKTILGLVWKQLGYEIAEFNIEKNILKSACDSLVAERNSLVAERDSLVAERDSLVAERDSLVASTIWRATKWLRKGITETKKFLFN